MTGHSLQLSRRSGALVCEARPSPFRPAVAILVEAAVNGDIPGVIMQSLGFVYLLGKKKRVCQFFRWKSWRKGEHCLLFES